MVMVKPIERRGFYRVNEIAWSKQGQRDSLEQKGARVASAPQGGQGLVGEKGWCAGIFEKSRKLCSRTAEVQSRQRRLQRGPGSHLPVSSKERGHRDQLIFVFCPQNAPKLHNFQPAELLIRVSDEIGCEELQLALSSTKGAIKPCKLSTHKERESELAGTGFGDVDRELCATPPEAACTQAAA